MSASLVGSEMCIRDSAKKATEAGAEVERIEASLSAAKQKQTERKADLEDAEQARKTFLGDLAFEQADGGDRKQTIGLAEAPAPA
eukprot:12212378-Alexandrium_andersonii.AAC.1